MLGIRLALVFVFMIGFARVLEAQRDSTTVEYAVKVVCGMPDRAALAPGVYYTAINVHNPGRDSVRFRQKAALTRAGEVPGSISSFWSAVLGPDQALEIDCTDVMRRARVRGFLKGFVVIQSPQPLDVVAVYSAGQAPQRPVVDLEIERVAGRTMFARGCTLPDLVVDTIMRPVFESTTRSSRIEAVIRNIGPGAAPATLARLIDPSTEQSPGVPFNSVASTPPLAPGASATVVFTLPYWVFNPDADLEVTADYKNDVAECREDNNVKGYRAAG